MTLISGLFRRMPNFRGKFRLANLFFGSSLEQPEPIELVGKNHIRYILPNTIDHIGKEILVKGIYEKETIDLIAGLLGKDSVFCDVGANIGAITLPIAKRCKAGIHVFEPSKSTFSFLKRNIDINNLPNIFLNETAVHSTDGDEVTFYDVPENYGGSSLGQTYGDQPRYVVKTVSLDEYCKRNNIPLINVIKIDVQGYELEVLKGCKDLLQKKAILNIIFEFEGWAETNANFGAGAAQEYLISMGYELFTLKNKKVANVFREGSQMLWAKCK